MKGKLTPQIIKYRMMFCTNVWIILSLLLVLLSTTEAGYNIERDFETLLVICESILKVRFEWSVKEDVDITSFRVEDAWIVYCNVSELEVIYWWFYCVIPWMSNVCVNLTNLLWKKEVRCHIYISNGTLLTRGIHFNQWIKLLWPRRSTNLCQAIWQLFM